MLLFNLRILPSDFLEQTLPQPARVSHGVRLVTQQHAPPRRAIQLLVGGAVFKRITYDALHALARIHVLLNCDLVRRSLLEDSAQITVHALGVLADHDEIHVLGFDVFQRTKRRIHQPHGPDVGV